MAANTTPIFPFTPWMGVANLSAASACTTRGIIAYASLGLTPCFAVSLSPVSTNGRRIDRIQVQAISTSIVAPTVAQDVLIWASDGVNGWVLDEFQITAQTPSTTSPSFNTYKTYTTLVLPAAWTLWASTTVATTTATTALAVMAFGGDY